LAALVDPQERDEVVTRAVGELPTELDQDREGLLFRNIVVPGRGSFGGNGTSRRQLHATLSEGRSLAPS